jgi:UDP-N-acetylmuramate dehydrogenase
LGLALAWARGAHCPWRVLGNGSNLLVADGGVPGLVLHVRRTLDRVRRDDRSLTVGAGASLPAVARLCSTHGLAGLEFAAGIPGTVGGAVVMNAGWHEFELRGVVRSVESVGPDGTSRTDGVEACDFGYRCSRFRGSSRIVLGVELEMTREDPARIGERMARFAASRKAHQPTELPSCGSVFLKPPGDFAGRLIDAAGLKGLRVGDAQVSPKHANFFVNLGRARAADVLELVERVERIVLERFGVRLQREFELWPGPAAGGPTRPESNVEPG